MKTIGTLILVILALSAMSIANAKIGTGVKLVTILVTAVDDGVVAYASSNGDIYGTIGCHSTNVSVGDVIAHVRLFPEDGDQNMVRLNMQQGISDSYRTMHIRTCL